MSYIIVVALMYIVQAASLVIACDKLNSSNEFEFDLGILNKSEEFPVQEWYEIPNNQFIDSNGAIDQPTIQPIPVPMAVSNDYYQQLVYSNYQINVIAPLVIQQLVVNNNVICSPNADNKQCHYNFIPYDPVKNIRKTRNTHQKNKFTKVIGKAATSNPNQKITDIKKIVEKRLKRIPKQCHKTTFNTINELYRHLKQDHQTPLGFKCGYVNTDQDGNELNTCQEIYLTENGFKNHFITHLSPNAFECPACAFRFSCRNSLYVHYQNKHL
ncbi:MAG: hypothetical protein ACOYT8_02590 [Candidatus Dependentiae bacterium]